MRYLIGHKKLQRKYESEIREIIEDQKYQIKRIDVFAEFPDSLFPFRDCSVLLGVPVIPVSFAECESNNKLLGVETLAKNKGVYDDAKYEWVKKHCTNESISVEENFKMLKAIQEAILPFGIFTIAFRCHQIYDYTIKSQYNDKQIPFSPLIYDTEDIDTGVSDYFCRKLAEELDTVSINPSGDKKSAVYYQMNVYTDNILTRKDVDGIYDLIKKIMNKYNEYAMTMYHTYKESEVYKHRDDFPS